MSDRISLRGIRAYGKHGALPRERDHPQLFAIDLELEVDIARARVSDALADTLDYALIHARTVALVRDRSYALLERLADELAEMLLRDERVACATVTVAKPELLDGATPSVTVHRSRDARA
jgi:dihydroneopterin aldolase